MSQATVLIDSTASVALADACVIPVLAGAVTGTGGAIAAQVTLADLASFFEAPNAPLTITSTTTPQLSVRYDASNLLSVSVSSAGAITLNANGASAGFSFRMSDGADFADVRAADFVATGTVTALNGSANLVIIDFDGGGSYIGTTGAAAFKLIANNATALTIATTGAATFAGSLKATGAFGCNNATPQTPAVAGAALAAYTTGAFGLNSDANMLALYNLVVAMRAALVANGIMSVA